MLGDVEEEYRRRAVAGPFRAAAWRAYQLFGLLVSWRPRGDGPIRGRWRPGTWSIEAWWRDIQFAVRMLRRDRLVTLTVVATLSLGIGATTTMFSITHGLLRDLPLPEADRVMAIGIRDPELGDEDRAVPAADFEEWRSAQTTMLDIAAVDRRAFQVSAHAPQPMRYEGAAVSPWAFSVLEAEPILGRNFVVGDLDSPELPVVIAYQVWEDMFDRDPGVLDASLRVDGVVRRVIGVMPEGFGFPRYEYLWIPLRTDGPEAADRAVEVFGRLGADTDLDAAQAEFSALGQRSFLASTPVRERLAVDVKPIKYRAIGSDAPALLYTMLAIVALVLIIACANVTNVLIARSAVRRREVAVRAALGASRRRLIRQFLAETLVLALLGGVGGVLVADVAVRWFGTTLSGRIGIFWVSISVDPTVLTFAFGLTGLATALSGLAPALSASRADVATGLKDGAGSGSGGTLSSRRWRRLSHVLVAGEITLSCVMLVVSGLMVKGVMGLAGRDLHFDSDKMLTGRIQLGEFDYPDDDAVRRFAESLRERWRGQGRGDLVLTSRLPGRENAHWAFAIEGAEYPTVRDMPTATLRRVTPEIFTMLALAPVSGRVLDGRDRADAPPVAVVNTTFADRYFPNGAVGRRIRIGLTDSPSPWREIVGVVEDQGVTLEEGRTFPGILLSLAQEPVRTFELMVRESESDPSFGALRTTIASLDPNLPLFAVASLDAVLQDEILPQQTFGRLFAGFGLVALLLASVGLYGTMAFAVNSRAREIGLRRALGGTAPRVVGHLLRAAAWQLGIGLALGLSLAVLIAPAIGDFTFGTDPRDASVFTTVPLVLALTALVAAWFPSRRAARIEPMRVLKSD